MAKKEEFKVNGEDLVGKVKELVSQGNVRTITIKDKEGKVLVQLPLLAGVVGALLVPTAAAIGAIAALVTECTIIIERAEPDEM